MRSLKVRSPEGSSAVEFVFVLPLLVVLVFGIIQFGIAYNRAQGMHAAVREGARLAAIGASVSEIDTRVDNALNGTTVDAGDVTVTVRRYSDGVDPVNASVSVLPGTATPCDGTEVAHTVRVDAEVTSNVANYKITIPMLPLPDSVSTQTYPSTAIFRCEGGT